MPMRSAFGPIATGKTEGAPMTNLSRRIEYALELPLLRELEPFPTRNEDIVTATTETATKYAVYYTDTNGKPKVKKFVLRTLRDDFLKKTPSAYQLETTSTEITRLNPTAPVETPAEKNKAPPVPEDGGEQCRHQKL